VATPVLSARNPSSARRNEGPQRLYSLLLLQPRRRPTSRRVASTLQATTQPRAATRKPSRYFRTSSTKVAGVAGAMVTPSSSGARRSALARLPSIPLTPSPTRSNARVSDQMSSSTASIPLPVRRGSAGSAASAASSIALAAELRKPRLSNSPTAIACFGALPSNCVTVPCGCAAASFAARSASLVAGSARNALILRATAFMRALFHAATRSS